MIDLGTDDPQVFYMLERALGIIDDGIASLRSEMKQPEATSEIYRLHEELPNGPLNIVNALEVALRAGEGSLEQISTLFSHEVPTSPIVLQSLLRTAIIAAARLVHVLLPTEPEERLTNAKLVLALDAQSGTRAIEHYSNFEAMVGIRPPRELVDDFQSQLQELRPTGRLPGEGAAIKKMVTALSDALQMADFPDEIQTSYLPDHAQWLWNTYSGLAHAYMWPHRMWRISDDTRIPGDYPLDLYMTANSFLIGQLAYKSRAKHDSSGTTQRVDLA